MFWVPPSSTSRAAASPRLNLWTFQLPGLAERREDIEPNLDCELDRFAEREGDRASFNKKHAALPARSPRPAVHSSPPRGRRSTANDADRHRKYLARFALDWNRVSGDGSRA